MGTILIMVGGFCFAAYGREEMNYFTPQEVQASTFLINNAPVGSAILDLSWNWPKYFKDYENFTYVTLIEHYNSDRQKLVNDPVEEIAKVMKQYKNAYLILTRSQAAQIDMLRYLPPGSFQEIDKALRNSTEFKITYQNADSVIFTLNQPLTSGSAQSGNGG